MGNPIQRITMGGLISFLKEKVEILEGMHEYDTNLMTKKELLDHAESIKAAFEFVISNIQDHDEEPEKSLEDYTDEEH